MSSLMTVTLKCDFPGCKNSVSVGGNELIAARVRAAEAKGWSSGTGRVASATRDWCHEHPRGESLNVGLEDL